MSEPVSPRSEDWSAWATLANDVTEALGELDHHVLFSTRKAIAEVLWRKGYRPSVEQIQAVRGRQREDA